MSEKPFLARLLREPLLHFFLLGFGVFALYRLAGNSAETSRETITISARQIDLLAEGFGRTWQRPPSRQELQGLVQDAVQEEILYREAMAMGLDQNDAIVRRRLRQKMEFISEDLSAQAAPSEAELKAFFEKKRESLKAPAQISFSQVYLDPQRRGVEDAKRVMGALNTASAPADPAVLGDAAALEAHFKELPRPEVEKIFGPGFAAALFALSPGAWQGPVESGLGLHVVKVEAVKAAPPPDFDALKETLQREWQAERRAEFTDKLLQGLAKKYEIQVELEGWTAPQELGAK